MRYTHLLFDLDHTLWDYDRNASEALTEIFHSHNLQQHDLALPAFLEAYFTSNAHMWQLYSQGGISREDLRERRFTLLWQQLGLPTHSLPPTLSADFLRICPSKPHLLPGVMQALTRFKEMGFQLHIITNGFNDSQHQKMKAAGIHHFFTQITTSESCGAKKPDPAIFEYTLAQISAMPSQCLMVGDNTDSDVAGALAAGIHVAHYCPAGPVPGCRATVSVANFDALLLFLNQAPITPMNDDYMRTILDFQPNGRKANAN